MPEADLYFIYCSNMHFCLRATY